MNLSEYLDKNNLHHAYLIEGDKGALLSELFIFFENSGIDTKANPDFYHLEIDSFKMEHAKRLKSMTNERMYSDTEGAKRIFVISTNNFLLEAQNSLLKVFEEPIANTHFFILVPSLDIFLPTITSRFYLIKNNSPKNISLKEIESFIKLSKSARIEYLKEFLKEDEEEEEMMSVRSKTMHFVDDLELFLHSKYKLPKDTFLVNIFEQIFKVRKYLRQPGSSTKSLIESIALSIPEKMI